MVNYGLNKLRFPAALPVGDRVRMRLRLAAVDDVSGGVMLTSELTFEREGGDKPCAWRSRSCWPTRAEHDAALVYISDHRKPDAGSKKARSEACRDEGLRLGLEDESAVRSGFGELERRVHAAGREWIGAIVQRLIALGGADVLVGAIGDPDLGPVLAVGFGGRRAGLGRSAAFFDRQALRELMLRFALLLLELPEVVGTDLNPVRCMTNGCVVLAMRLRIEHGRSSASRRGDEAIGDLPIRGAVSRPCALAQLMAGRIQRTSLAADEPRNPRSCGRPACC